MYTHFNNPYINKKMDNALLNIICSKCPPPASIHCWQ